MVFEWNQLVFEWKFWEFESSNMQKYFVKDYSTTILENKGNY